MELTPKHIVTELDRNIIGQAQAKRAVAIALRNRYRRSKLSDELREEIYPKNIIMKGPTGVGKTEIARRLAKLVKAPFIKVEATKFTEVGYVGRDVESMIRDLAEASVRLVKNERIAGVKPRANALAINRVADIMFPKYKEGHEPADDAVIREELIAKIKDGKFDNAVLDVEIMEAPQPMPAMPGIEINIGDMLGNMLPKRRKRKRLAVADAIRLFENEECDKLIDNDSVNAEALRRAEQDGIIFIDEIDKIAGATSGRNGPDVSREGVQRDILPIVEGCTVSTKYGPIKTDYILFIAAGAFHVSKIEDLIPELQGRFPITVELDSLTKEDFVNILSNTENSLPTQYGALLAVDNIKLTFTSDAIDEIANIAVTQNETHENIGARRLHSIMENLLEDISFNATGDHPLIEVVVDKTYVLDHLDKLIRQQDLRKYII